MKEKKRSTISYVLEWAEEKKWLYFCSVILAVCSVIAKILPYFAIGDIVNRVIDGQNESVQTCQSFTCPPALRMGASSEAFLYRLLKVWQRKADASLQPVWKSGCREELCDALCGFEKNPSDQRRETEGKAAGKRFRLTIEMPE